MTTELLVLPLLGLVGNSGEVDGFPGCEICNPGWYSKGADCWEEGSEVTSFLAGDWEGLEVWLMAGIGCWVEGKAAVYREGWEGWEVDTGDFEEKLVQGSGLPPWVWWGVANGVGWSGEEEVWRETSGTPVLSGWSNPPLQPKEPSGGGKPSL